MSSTITRYDVLVSCPGDVVRLLPVVEDALNDFNKHYADSHMIELCMRHWSSDMYPRSGGKPQDLINEVVLPRCDAAIAIFWCKLGTPTDRYESGTVEEIEQMLDSGRQVFVYFSKEPVPYEVAKGGIDSRIDEFKNRYRDRGVYWEFSDGNELTHLLSRHLRRHFIDHDNREATQTTAGQREPMLRLAGIVSGRIASTARLNRHFYSPVLKDTEALKDAIVDELRTLSASYDEQVELQRRVRDIVADTPAGALGIKLQNEADSKMPAGLRDFRVQMGSKVSLPEETVDLFKEIARYEGISLAEGFLEFEGLTSFDIPLNGGTQFYGSEDEEKRYLSLLEIEKKIQELYLWRSFERTYGDLLNVTLALENAGTAPDADIDLYMELPETSILPAQELPVPGEWELQDMDEEVGLRDYFRPSVGMRIQHYHFEYAPPPRNLSSVNYVPDYRPEEDREILEDCFPYEYETDRGVTTVGLHFDQIRQHTAVSFPTPVFLREPVDCIPYEIVSRGLGEVARGILDVVDEPSE